MNKKKMVGKFLSRGKLVTPHALESLMTEKNTSLYLEKEGLFTTRHDFEKLVIKKNITESKKEMTTQDFTSYYQSRYAKIREILVNEKPRPYVSIDKINRDFKQGFVIGMVRSVEDGMVIEDMTGELKIQGKGPEPDDVVAVEVVRDKGLRAKNIIYPDVPLRSATTGNGRAVFVSDMHLDEEKQGKKFLEWFNRKGVKNLFIAGDIGDQKTLEDNVSGNKRVFVIPGEADGNDYPQLPLNLTNGIISLSNPSMVELNGLKVLMVHEFEKDMLVKRHMGEFIFPEDQMVLEEVPDVVHHGHTHQQSIDNYKSITMINSGSPKTPVILDFKTRKYKVIEL